MGAWGFLPFENDDALDWLDELEAGGAEVVRDALAKAGAGYVEAPDGSVAIAAAEVASACQGNPPGDLPENVATWVTAHGAELGPEDVELALRAVERVAGDESEVAELWDDADEPEWRESLVELTERLRGAQSIPVSARHERSRVIPGGRATRAEPPSVDWFE
jgi:predicted nucleic acid-binding protein